MKLSTKGRYAVRAMIDLAIHAEEGPVARADISCRQDISADYMARLFINLQDAGLVRGIKGPGGGYMLMRSPSEISVGDIVRAVEGPIALVSCVEPGGERACEYADRCVTRQIWQRASEAIADVLNGITLEELSAQACDLGEAFVRKCPG
ncbi:MAG: Rrf2 family transcriptional regulator [Anaerolineae bacterium]|nr:Rrf2 family transcriptional regulator [Anaerolineae bacterium]